MTRSRSWFGGLLLALVLLAWLAPEGQARGAPRSSLSATIEQCANRLGGTTSSINNCAGSGWVTGNLNVNNSVYRQGDFVPFRTRLGDLVAGRTYALDIGYDAVESGLHAYDYLGTYDASAFPGQQVVPCFGVANTAGPHACGHNPSTLPVPTDTNTTFPDGSHPPPEPAGNFSAWGANLQGAVYTSTTPIGPDTAAKVQRTMKITFVADGPNAVLAWGGHIASALDWGAARTYTSVHNGAPFHMRLGGQFCEVGGDCSTTGNQDLSLHAFALAPVPGLSTQVAPSSATIDQPVVDTATLTGVSGSGAVRGTVGFFVCFNATAQPACTQGGTSIGFQNVVVGAGSNGTASMEFTADQEIGGQGPGFYCFRVEYTPAPDALYTPALHTNQTTECFQATLPPPLLTVTKVCDPEDDPGLFNLLLDGSPIPNGTNVPCGGSRGPSQTTTGSHTVSESAGTGTNLSHYTSTIGGDCAADGSITLALGTSAICTITNVNTFVPPPPSAKLTVDKVCDPANDQGSFEILVDDVPIAVLSCGGSATVELPPGDHTLREASGENTSLSDYTTVISGDCAADGSITLTAGGSASCTFTNTRIPPTTTLRVDKICDPAGDAGHFNLLIATIAGTPVHRVTVGCGGTTGAVQVAPGQYVVRERGANGTNLSDYDRFVGGDCGFDGTVVVEAGQQLTCQITNVRKGTQPQPAELTVTKLCVPTDDGGRFDLTVDGQTERDVACGESFGPVALAPGTHLVSESAGTGTNLADYATTIGGACAVDGSVTLAAGEQATCTITNVRRGTEPPEPPQETGTVEIQKQCSPAGTQGNFQVEFDEQVFRIACGESTGPVEIAVGDHRVGEVVALDDNTTANFTSTIGGDCALDGSFTLSAGEHVVCVVTNTTAPIEPPILPPSDCYTLSASPHTATARKRVRVVARVHAGRRPVAGVRVYLRGPGISVFGTTGRTGRVVFEVTPRRRGILRVSIRQAFDCPARPPHDIGIRGVQTPPVTG